MSKLKGIKLHKKRRTAEGEVKRIKRRDAATLDEALQQVARHEQPRLDGEAYATTQIEEIDGAGRPQRRTKVIALRDDPLAQLYKRGMLEMDGDRDALDAGARFTAGRRWQKNYLAAEIGRAAAIDFERPIVDGGPASRAELDRLDAVQYLARVDARLGQAGGELLRLVLGEGKRMWEIAAAAGQQSNRARHYYGRRLCEVLQTLAEMEGLISRPAPKPRREPDQWDILSRYAKQPDLLKAILRARQGG